MLKGGLKALTTLVAAIVLVVSGYFIGYHSGFGDAVSKGYGVRIWMETTPELRGWL